MLWHQILKEGYTLSGEAMRQHRQMMISAEKLGYRTLSWTAMHHLTSTMRLTHSLAEPLFGSYPDLTPVWRHKVADTDRSDTAGRCNWLLLTSIQLASPHILLTSIPTTWSAGSSR
eukprot:771575-Rhodomonas_salina.1